MKGNKDPFKGNNIYPYVKEGRTLLALTKFVLIASYAIVIFSGIVLSIMLLLPSDIPEKILNKTYAQENENNDIDLKITDGIASGDITNDSVVIWSRVNHPAQMNVEYAPISNSSHSLNQTAKANATTDYTAHAKLEGLQPDTRYKYNVSFIPLLNNSNRNEMRHPDFANGTFKTAPVSSKEQLVNFVVGGDLGGQRYCKRLDIGYPIFTVIKELSPDFFVSNGDMIYADNDCPVSGPQGTVGWKNIPGNFRNITDPNVNWENRTQLSDMYLKHWEYNRSDKHYQNLLSYIPMYSQADDHEVADDYSGKSEFYKIPSKDRKGFPNLIKEGLGVFFNFSPIDRNPEEPLRIYRSFQWGKDLEIFLLDAHQYRSPGYLPETLENNKTLLGNKQMDWLKKGLQNSKATWKAIITDVPVTIPNCFNSQEDGCDNWATDGIVNQTFTRERAEFFKFLDDNNINNIISIVTDTHYPANVLVKEDANGDGDIITLYELVSGPLNAGTFGPDILDPTINAKYLYNESGFFNFGHYTVQRDDNGTSHFISEIRTSDGLIRPSSHLDLITANEERK